MSLNYISFALNCILLRLNRQNPFTDTEVRNYQWCWKTSGQNLKYFSNDVMCHTVLMCYNVGKHYLRYIFWKQCTSLSLQVWGECNTKYFIHSELSIHWLIYNGCEVSICPLLSILCMKKLTVDTFSQEEVFPKDLITE